MKISNGRQAAAARDSSSVAFKLNRLRGSRLMTVSSPGVFTTTLLRLSQYSSLAAPPCWSHTSHARPRCALCYSFAFHSAGLALSIKPSTTSMATVKLGRSSHISLPGPRGMKGSSIPRRFQVGVAIDWVRWRLRAGCAMTRMERTGHCRSRGCRRERHQQE